MPENERQSPDPEILIQQYLDGTLDETGVQGLFDAVMKDGDVRRHLAEHFAFDSELRDTGFVDSMPVPPRNDSGPEADAAFWEVVGEQTYSYTPKRFVEAPKKTWFQRPKWPFQSLSLSSRTVNRLLLLNITALLAVIGSFFLYDRSRETVPQQVEQATFLHFQNVRWKEEPSCDFLGRTILSKRLSILSGQLAVKLSGGVNLLLQGASEMQILSDRHISCDTGKFFLDVPPQREPFRVRLPQFSIKVVGTSFILDAASSESTIYMSRGRVVLEDIPGGPLTLEAGQAVTVTASKEIRNFSPDVEPPPSFDHLAHEALDRTEMRKRYISRLKQDSATVVHMNFERTSTRKSMKGKLNWVLGRTPGKWSLRFPYPDDDLFLPVRGDFRQATFLAWIRRDSLKEDRNALLYNDRIRWCFSNDGGLRFQESGLPLRKPMPIPGELADQWICVAVVVDTDDGIIRHYLNGREILSESHDRLPLSCDGIRLGGGVYFDEFLFSKRPFTSEEIEEFYRSTK